MSRTARVLSPGALLVAIGFCGNLLVALVFMQRGLTTALLVALIPVVLVVFGMLIAQDRRVLLYAALGLGVSIGFLNRPLPFSGKPVFAADFVATLALVAGLGGYLLRGSAPKPPRRSSPALGLPLVLFGLAVVLATLRGHERFGAPIFAQPLRLVLYAAIACVLTTLAVRDVWRAAVVVFYGGTIWMFFSSIYYLGTGTSQTDQINLSTGGTRILAASIGIYEGGALLLALLNLETRETFAGRAFDMLIAALAAFEIVIAYGRGSFLALGMIVPVLALFYRGVRNALFAMVPVLLPFLVLTAIFLPRFAPDVAPTFVKRVTANTSKDINVRWREIANRTAWETVHESPLTGVGFGGIVRFSLVDTSTFPPTRFHFTVEEGTHNSYVWLAAGGGLFCLGAFVLIVIVALRDAFLRLRHATRNERLLIIWSLSTLFVFLVNAYTGPILSNPTTLLAVWTLLLIPSVVPKRDRPDTSTA